MEKSAAKDACLPSFPTMPTPVVNLRSFNQQLTDVSRLNHAHVVAAVADATNCFTAVVANQTSHIGFLCGGTAACHHRRELSGQGNELGAEFVETQLRTSDASDKP